MQSWEWGAARKKMGIEVIKIKGDNTIYQMTIHPIPHTSFSIGYIPRSPVPSKKTLDELYSLGKKHRLIFIKIEPYVILNSFQDPNKEMLKQVQHDGLTKSSHPLFPEWTQTLDLTPSEDELLKAMKPKTRYNIRLAEKKGVVIKEESTDKGYEVFEKLYFETCKRQKYRGHTPAYHEMIWQALKNNQAHILVAYLGETPLAAYELLVFKDRIYYLYGGSSLLHKNVMAPNLLMWRAIQLGKKWGASEFDMWGSLPPNYLDSHPWAGFTRFKEGYGTTFTHLLGSFDLVINPVFYFLYGAAYHIRNAVL